MQRDRLRRGAGRAQAGAQGPTPGRSAPARLAAVVLACGLLLPGAPAAQAGDPAAGRAKAQACAVCHGPLGLSIAPDAPNLAGQPEIYLVRQLTDYRGGKRVHEVMSVIAKPLGDDEIRDLAAWFSSLRIEVKDKP